MPKVSVIMPVYRVEKYLGESLESVRNQTLKEIEVICVDDGGTDACPRMLDEAAASDPRIRVIHQENHGYGYSVNAGFDAAEGEYLAILEPDDILPESALEKLYRIAREQDADLVKGDYCEMTVAPDGTKKMNPARLHAEEDYYGSVFSAWEKPGVLMSQVINCTGIFRRSLIRDCGIRLSETPGASYQDISLFFPLMVHAGRIIFTHEITYLYRTDNPNASTKDKGKIFLGDAEYEKAQQEIRGMPDSGELLAVSWAARWRGMLGVLRRIDPALYGEFMGRMRPVMEEAGRNGLPRRKDLSAYQWALLRRFRKGDDPLLRAIAIEKGRWRSAYRLLLRLRYDGIAGTFRFIRGKKFTA